MASSKTNTPEVTAGMVEIEPFKKGGEQGSVEHILSGNLAKALQTALEKGKFTPQSLEVAVTMIRDTLAAIEGFSQVPLDHPVKRLDTAALNTMLIPISEASVGKDLMDAFAKMDDEPECFGDLLIHKEVLLHRLRGNEEATQQLKKILEENGWDDFNERDLDVIQHTYYEVRNSGGKANHLNGKGMKNRGHYSSKVGWKRSV